MHIMYQFLDISGIFIMFLLAKYAKLAVHLGPPNCTAAGTGKRCRARPPRHPTREEARGRSQTSMLTSKTSGSLKNPMVELIIYHIYMYVYSDILYIYVYIYCTYLIYIQCIYIVIYLHCIHTLYIYIYTFTLYVYSACIYTYIYYALYI